MTIDYPEAFALKDRLADPTSRTEALRVIGDWCALTCILFGASATTAYAVAATMVAGIERAYTEHEAR